MFQRDPLDFNLTRSEKEQSEVCHWSQEKDQELIDQALMFQGDPYMYKHLNEFSKGAVWERSLTVRVIDQGVIYQTQC